MKLLQSRTLRFFLIACASTWLYSGLVFAQQIRVVATFPDLADITRQIGKELVSVDSLATGVEDPHGVPMRPSFVPRLNRADVLVLTGLDDRALVAPRAFGGCEQSQNFSGATGLYRLFGRRIRARDAHRLGSRRGRSSPKRKSALYVGSG